MLIPAKAVEERLESKLQVHAFKDRLKHYFTSGRELLEFDLRENTWFELEVASVAGKEVLGYLDATIDRQNHSVEGLNIVRLTENPSVTFAVDTKDYFEKLFEKWSFDKVKWKAATENPNVRQHRALAEMYGGREVGVFENDKTLPDGTKTDIVLFELTQENYSPPTK